ncbi:MAG: hypothetical protein RSA10_01690 [Bacilli bacterium]
MYIDLVIVIIFLGFCVMRNRKNRFSSFVYGVGILDMFLRIFSFLKSNVALGKIGNVINSYVPSSIPSLINKYLPKNIGLIITWAYVAVFIVFLYYTIKIFWKKKRY